MSDVKCQHCGWRKRNRAHGLCFACSQDPSLRDQYRTSAVFCSRCAARLGDSPGTRRPDGLCHRCSLGAPVPPTIAAALELLPHADPGPTRARQGSAAKLAVLIRRAEARVPLWHPEDGCPGDE